MGYHYVHIKMSRNTTEHVTQQLSTREHVGTHKAMTKVAILSAL